MEIYNVIIEDRRNDVVVRSFLNRERAIEIAKETATSRNEGRGLEYLKEDIIEGWEYYIEYSCEGDCVRVVKTMLES
jgi:hypothetical protein